MQKSLYWADQIARKIIKDRKRNKYTCAAGITPSGTVHIGNFREIITAHLVERALSDSGKNVRFIYSWDDYDRFRKVPKNVPKRETLQKEIGKPVSEVFDPFGCHKNWAEHFEEELEKSLVPLGIKPHYISQTKMYKACKYAEEIKIALKQRNVIKDILDDYRRESLPENWFPLWVFCEKCGKDSTKVLNYDDNYTIEYKCDCGFKNKIDFRKKGIVALPWRIDWPMRWKYEKVDFEAGGKEHSTPGGSYTTSCIITKKIFDYDAPGYQMYDYIIVKGRGGKMSSSEGDVISVADTLKIYLPELVRYLFASTKPVHEFAIPLDEEVFKVYEDFYETERIYFGKEKNVSKRDKTHRSRVYELSMLEKPPKSMPAQPRFTHCVELINIHQTPEKALTALGKLSKLDKDRYLAIFERAKNWLEKYAPEEYKFKLQEKLPRLSTKEKEIIEEFTKNLKRAKTEKEIALACKESAEKTGLSIKEFFQIIYKILIGKERGPRLAPFILAIGKKKIIELLSKV